METPNNPRDAKIPEDLLDAALAGAFGGMTELEAEAGSKRPTVQLIHNKHTPRKPSPDDSLPSASDVAIDGYDVLETLGRGGMGVVYYARHHQLNRHVAIKMILSGAHADKSLRTRFHREAEAAARLQHPNIVQIHEIGEQDGIPFLAFEYVSGGSLFRQMDGTPWKASRAAELTATLADAVHEAHRNNVVHRDLKPANVLVAEDGAPKVADFGLAKLLDGNAEDTESGAILGTPNYMAPELAEGKARSAGAAVDVYALGAILYELLTGRPPFVGETAMDVMMMAISADPVSPLQLQPKLPRDLDTICLKCLEKDPGKRYASAAALAEDLRLYAEGKPIQARPVSAVEKAWRWSRRKPALAGSFAAAGVLALAVVVLAIVYAWERSNAADTAERLTDIAKTEEGKAKRNEQTAKTNAKSARRTTELMYAEKGMRLAEQGEFFEALHWFIKPLRQEHGPMEMERQHRLRLACYLRFSGMPKLRSILPHPDSVESLRYSPDRSRIIVRTGARLCLWDAAAGTKKITPKEYFLWGRHVVSADGKWALVRLKGANVKGARLLNVEKNTFVSTMAEEQKTIRYTILSTDGKWAAITATGLSVRIWNAKEGLPVGQQMIGAGAPVAFSPDGARLLTHTRQGYELWRTETGERLGALSKPNTPIFKPVFSADGKRLALATKNFAVQVWDVAEKPELVCTVYHKSNVECAAFSRDGRLLVTGGTDSIAQVWDATTGKRIGAECRHEFFVHTVAFDPDGKRIATGDDRGKARVWDATTGAPLGPWMQHNAPVRSVAFHPDGGKLLTGDGDGVVRVWTPARQSATAKLPQSFPVRRNRVQIRPDGRELLIAGEERIAICNVAGQRVRFLAFPKSKKLVAQYTKDGRRFLVANQQTLTVYDTESAKPVGKPMKLGDKVARVDIAPGGRWIVVFRSDRAVDLYDAVKQRRVKMLFQRRVHWLSRRPVPFNADGRYAAFILGGSVQVWDLQTAKPVGPAIRQSKSVQRMCLDPQSLRVAVADERHRIHVYDVKTGKPASGPMQHLETVNRMQFSPNGRHLVSSSYDHTTRVWDAASGEPASPPWRSAGLSVLATFGPRGKLVATAGDDGVARVWDVESGQAVTPPLKHTVSEINYVGFTPDGQRLITVDENGTVRFWLLTRERRNIETLLRLSQRWHGRRLDRWGALAPLPISKLNSSSH